MNRSADQFETARLAALAIRRQIEASQNPAEITALRLKLAVAAERREIARHASPVPSII
jgi:hypothetical protein